MTFSPPYRTGLPAKFGDVLENNSKGQKSIWPLLLSSGVSIQSCLAIGKWLIY
ncbi:hypothetical protein [Shewanella sp.]|uniref:hypothetical protein n=1 Tax=Shewanella sp. TaxID=50422 RepID=UPI003F669445